MGPGSNKLWQRRLSWSWSPPTPGCYPTSWKGWSRTKCINTWVSCKAQPPQTQKRAPCYLKLQMPWTTTIMRMFGRWLLTECQRLGDLSTLPKAKAYQAWTRGIHGILEEPSLFTLEAWMVTSWPSIISLRLELATTGRLYRTWPRYGGVLTSPNKGYLDPLPLVTRIPPAWSSSLSESVLWNRYKSEGSSIW